MKLDENWWKHGVIYHVYVRSFHDSNNDGIGDLPGVIEKLDYIEEMGFSGIWLSPIFTSPMVDFGYDISDYYSIDPQYGTLEDLKRLVKEARRRGISIIMDIALNHTSDQHPWFLESKSSRCNSEKNSKRDWYVWREGKFFGPPNNWVTGFFQSAWKYDRTTGEYYLHSFLKNQPDVNWHNEEVRREFMRIFQFWMALGVAGFRLDMVNWLVKDSRFRDNPYIWPFKMLQKQVYNKNRKQVFPVLNLIRQTIDASSGVTVGEVFTLPPGDPELSAFYLGNGKNSLHLAFDFSMMYRFWNARQVFKAVFRWVEAVDENAWPTHVFSNHDQRRSFSRLCRGSSGLARAKVLATLLLTIPGTPFVYYGEELGMKNPKLKKKDIVDPLGLKFWPLYKGRDSSRTPMKWNGEKNAGFSGGLKTWLPVDDDYRESNVETQSGNPDSLLNFYKALIRLRNEEETLHSGDWKIYEDGKNGIISYSRSINRKNIFVVLNFKSKNVTMKNLVQAGSKVLFSTHQKQDEICQEAINHVMPHEATIFICTAID